MIVQILSSILFGLIPEVLYFTLFICFTKNIKEKRIKLFLLISLAYILCMFIQRYKVVYYVLFIALIYLILKLLYKEKVQIIDVFVFSVSFSYICIISFIFSRFLVENLSNYYIIMLINRIFIFVPLLFKNRFNKIYNYYNILWNRSKNKNEKRPIKSITLRNLSLILLNLLIFFINLATINIINL